MGTRKGKKTSPVVKFLIAGLVLCLLSVSFVVLSLVAVMGGAISEPPDNCAPDGTASAGDDPEQSQVKVDDLSGEQTETAQTILDVADDLGVPEYGKIIAIAVGYTESSLKSLGHGDRDSLGVFQQRPSQGWGSPEQIQDPVKATEAFFGRAQHTNNPGLLDVTNWKGKSVGVAAQEVQRSAYADGSNFAKHEALARRVIDKLEGKESDNGDDSDEGYTPVGSGGLALKNNEGKGVDSEMCSTGLTANCVVTPWPDLERGLTPDARRVLRCLHAAFPQIESFGGKGDRPANPESDHDSGRAVDAMIPNWQKPGSGGVSFKVATYNALGKSHTAPGGNKQGKYAGYRKRTRAAVRAIRDKDLDIISFQEFQPPQQKLFRRLASEYAVSDGNRDNRVAWRKSVFTKLKERSLVIPYFNGQKRRMPYVLLEHRNTGQMVWVMSVHNPADTKRFKKQQRYRNEATRREAQLANDLMSTGVPLIIGGDMNDRRRYFCSTIRSTTLHAANGGTPGQSRRCDPPKNMWIDWLMGSAQVAFTQYEKDKSGPDLPGASDHPIVTAMATVGGSGVKLGDLVAAWARAGAKRLGIKYIIWDEQIWSVARSDEGWRSYTHPSGATDPTSAHRDHVHISVYGNATSQTGGAGGDLAPGSWTNPLAAGYRITNTFNQPASYYASGYHTGLDFAAGSGTPIRAASSGKVLSTGWGGAYGNLTKIQHAGGVQTWYAHQSSVSVKAGQRVKPGQQIGQVGNTGNSFGAHLHFEVRVNGKLRDPATYLGSQGVLVGG